MAAIFDQIAERYPLIFRAYRNKRAGPRAPIAYWGCECGPGWAAIVEELCSWLEPEAAQLKAAGKRVPVIMQVKEKMGTLRCHVAQVPKALAPEFEARREHAERRSAITCEVCGQPGVLLADSSGCRTLCEAHEVERQREKLARAIKGGFA